MRDIVALSLGALLLTGCAGIGEWDNGEEVLTSHGSQGVTIVARDYQDFLSGLDGTRIFARNRGSQAVCVRINNNRWVYVPAGEERLLQEGSSLRGTSEVDNNLSLCS